jgi:hypothetical protein
MLKFLFCLKPPPYVTGKSIQQNIPPIAGKVKRRRLVFRGFPAKIPRNTTFFRKIPSHPLDKAGKIGHN